MSTNTSHGNTQSGRMDIFDKLPKALRVALANSDHNWSGEQLYRARRKKLYQDKIGTIPQAIAFIREQDIKKHRADAEEGIICGNQR